MDDIKFCVSTYSFSKLIKKGEMTQFDTIKKAKEMGFDGIEVVEFDAPEGEDIKAYAKRFKEECERVGLEVANFCTGADFISPKEADTTEAEIERVKKIVDAVEILGAKTMRHDAVSSLGDYVSFEAALPGLAEAIREVAEYAQTKGIKTMVENHGYVVQDALRIEKLYTTVNHKNFGLLLDMGNFLCAGENLLKAASIVAPYAAMVHAKDFYYKSGDGMSPGEQFSVVRDGSYIKGAILGHGVVPVVQILRAIKRADYKGWISLEYEGYEDVLEGIRIGFDNLKRYTEVAYNA